MAYGLERTHCCGAYIYHGITRSMGEKQHLEKLIEETNKHSYGLITMYDVSHEDQGAGNFNYAHALSAEIRKKEYGEITGSAWVKNPNSGNFIQAITWIPNEAWFDYCRKKKRMDRWVFRPARSLAQVLNPPRGRRRQTGGTSTIRIPRPERGQALMGQERMFFEARQQQQRQQRQRDAAHAGQSMARGIDEMLMQMDNAVVPAPDQDTRGRRVYNPDTRGQAAMRQRQDQFEQAYRTRGPGYQNMTRVEFHRRRNNQWFGGGGGGGNSRGRR